MRRYRYMDKNWSMPKRSLAWFVLVRGGRLMRQYERHDPGFLAIAYAEAHLGRIATRW